MMFLKANIASAKQVSFTSLKGTKDGPDSRGKGGPGQKEPGACCALGRGLRKPGAGGLPWRGLGKVLGGQFKGENQAASIGTEGFSKGGLLGAKKPGRGAHGGTLGGQGESSLGSQGLKGGALPFPDWKPKQGIFIRGISKEARGPFLEPGRLGKNSVWTPQNWARNWPLGGVEIGLGGTKLGFHSMGGGSLGPKGRV